MPLGAPVPGRNITEGTRPLNTGHFRTRCRVSSLGMLPVVFDVWFRPQDVGDLFLRTRRDGLVNLELWDGRLIRAGNVLLREVLVVGRHGGFLWSATSTAYTDLAAAEPRILCCAQGGLGATRLVRHAK